VPFPPLCFVRSFSFILQTLSRQKIVLDPRLNSRPCLSPIVFHHRFLERSRSTFLFSPPNEASISGGSCFFRLPLFAGSFLRVTAFDLLLARWTNSISLTREVPRKAFSHPLVNEKLSPPLTNSSDLPSKLCPFVSLVELLNFVGPHFGDPPIYDANPGVP